MGIMLHSFILIISFVFLFASLLFWKTMLRNIPVPVVDVMIIKVENLTKTYKSYERGNTFREAVYSLFVRKTNMWKP